MRRRADPCAARRSLGLPDADPARGATAVVLVLAGGHGRRFAAALADRAAPHPTHVAVPLLPAVDKLRQPLGDRTVLQHTLAACGASGLPSVVQESPQPGIGDSIAAAVALAPPTTVGWLVLPGDLPLIRPATLRVVAAALQSRVGQRPATVVRPWHRGQPGHPVGFGPAWGPALRTLRGEAGAASLLRAAAPEDRVDLEVDDEGCVLDVDTPDALAAAARLLGARGTLGDQAPPAAGSQG